MVKQVSKKSYLIKKSCVFSDMQHNKQPDSDVQRAKKPFQGWRNQGVRGALCVKIGFYVVISWESRYNNEIKV